VGAISDNAHIFDMVSDDNSVDSADLARGIASPLSPDLNTSMTAGLTALKRVRTDFPNIPVIVVSSHDQLQWLQKLLFLGAKEVLISPLVAKNRDIILKYGRISRRLRSTKDSGMVTASVDSSPASSTAQTPGGKPNKSSDNSPKSRERSAESIYASPGSPVGPVPRDYSVDQDMVIPSAGILQKMGVNGKPKSNRRSSSALRQEILRSATAVEAAAAASASTASAEPGDALSRTPVPIPIPAPLSIPLISTTETTIKGETAGGSIQENHSAVGMCDQCVCLTCFMMC
jgi:CheY-like chemotaxis protein